MTTCSKCGAQLQGDERFCVKCGNDMSAQPAVAASAVPVVQAPQAMQPAAYAMPGGIPVAVPLPMPAPQKKRGLVWVLVVLGVLVLAYYYHAKHQPVAQAQPSSNPAPPAGAPAQPGSSPAAPGAAPGGAPSQPGVNPGQPVATPMEVQQQALSGRYVAEYGFVEVVGARWANNSTVTMRSATIECIQYAANGAALSETTNSLNGPVDPGHYVTFGPFQMGRIVAYATRVNCGIIQAYPAT
jgi:zinc-ribbon domain